MAKKRRDPFEVPLSAEKQEELARWLHREIDEAIQVRETIVGTDGAIEQAWFKYEGGDKNLTKSFPWPGAANLGSPIITEKVDALRARMMATVFGDPIWTVEGYGSSAERAPVVESYHQWKAETLGLQKYVGRVFQAALVEGTGVLEVTDRVDYRKGLRRARVLLQRDEMTGLPMLDETGQPVPVIKENGTFQEAEPGEPHLSMIVSDVVRATTGPSFRVLSLRDFFIIPGHAAELSDVWAYAKRFYRRLPELQAREKQGFYKNVEALGKSGEREATSEETRQGISIAQQYDETAELEIWEVNLLADLDDDGFEEWYVVTLSTRHDTILRVQYKDYNTPQYILFTPFPRSFSVYGYSYADTKLGSLYDEHAALRNMYMDRSILATAAPMKVLEGSPFDVNTRPWGPREKIRVRDMNEVMPLDVKDVPNSVMAAMNMVLQFAERISGQNDTATGVLSQQDRTLGEVKLTTEQSWVRIDEVVKNIQEAMEDLFLILNAIYISALEENPEEMPDVLTQVAVERGIDLGNKMTADVLLGIFRGKPKGSVEASDFSRMRADFAQLLTALTQMAQGSPALAAHLQSPNVIRSILTQLARIYRWPDRHNLVTPFTGQPPMPMMPPMGPGAPAGLPPAPPQQGGSGVPVNGPNG